MNQYLDEGDAAFLNAQVAMLNCRVEAMKAENAHRLATVGHGTYGEDAFDAALTQFRDAVDMSALENLWKMRQS